MSFFEHLRKQKFLSFTMILFTLSIGVVIGTLINTGVKAAKESNTAPGAMPLAVPSPVQLSTAFTQIAKQVEPSVVNISTTYLPKAPAQARRGRPAPQPDEGDNGDDDNGMQDFLYRFFGNPFGQGGPEMPQRKGYALGSGVVVDHSGYILTNNHVVDKADRIQVKFNGDPTEYNAKVVGVDAPTDLAVIRVLGKNGLMPARIGNSDAVQVGDWAVAIGSPFGYDATVTAGIISAKERDVDPTQQFQHFLQTDAAINPGNSGGPLLNIRGEVIGINTAIASRSGGFQGIGFAMPMNTAVKVYNDIIKNGKVTRGGIGIEFTPSDSEQARNLLKAYGANEGVFVQRVTPGGPADKAGLKSGDIIVALNGQQVRNGGDLVDRITATPVGTPVEVTVLRNGKRENVKVVVADLAQTFPDRFGNGANSSQAAPEGTQAKFGITISNMSQDKRDRMGLKQAGGVLVDSVDPGSFADDIGLMRGDVLMEINRQPVNSVDDVTRMQKTLRPGSAVAFRVMRSNGRSAEWTSVFVAGTLPTGQE